MILCEYKVFLNFSHVGIPSLHYDIILDFENNDAAIYIVK